LNEYGVVRVNRHVMISFSVGKYKDEVLCDVVPMHATHLLLGSLGNLIEKPSTMGLRTGIHWRRMEGFIHLPHSHQSKCMKINFN
jgi:hypothetical protein